MSVLVTIEAAVKDRKAFDDFAKRILSDTRAFEGCRGLTVHYDEQAPEKVLLVEQWESRADHEKYLAWRQETGVLDEIMAQLEGPPSIRYFSYIGA